MSSRLNEDRHEIATSGGTASLRGFARTTGPSILADMSGGRYLIDPETITLVDDDGDIAGEWETPGALFDELVWAGCPLFRDPDGAVFIDIELDQRSRPTRVHLNDVRIPTTTISEQAAWIVTQWQWHRER